MAAERPELIVADARAWRSWLANHRDSQGVRLVLAKKGAVMPTSLTHAEALEEALCYGWIDGQGATRDQSTWRVLFTPRRARSMWSKRNVERVTRLTAEGRMDAAGIAEVERARADGRYQAAYSGPATIEVPADLAMALDANPKAMAMFRKLNRQNRYAVLYRVTTARRADTRARRVEQFVQLLARGETLHPQSG
ncbi:MAG TPA: YdeI/OmpD-associated family protein [Candidatus Dormibacteraeota bacterium]